MNFDDCLGCTHLSLGIIELLFGIQRSTVGELTRSKQAAIAAPWLIGLLLFEK